MTSAQSRHHWIQQGRRQAGTRGFLRNHSELRAIFLEFPVWLNNTGTAIVAKQHLDPPVLSSRAQAAEAHEFAAESAADSSQLACVEIFNKILPPAAKSREQIL